MTAWCGCGNDRFETHTELVNGEHVPDAIILVADMPNGAAGAVLCVWDEVNW